MPQTRFYRRKALWQIFHIHLEGQNLVTKPYPREVCHVSGGLGVEATGKLVIKLLKSLFNARAMAQSLRKERFLWPRSTPPI